jgi:hypothetical protein
MKNLKAWLAAIFIGSAVLGISCWFAAGFFRSSDLEVLLLSVTDIAFIVFFGCGALLVINLLPDR